MYFLPTMSPSLPNTRAPKGRTIKPAAKVANDGRAKCYECHDEIKALKEGSKHANYDKDKGRSVYPQPLPFQPKFLVLQGAISL